MAKFCGNIGFAITGETVPGVWTETIVERKYYGDLLQNNRKLENSGYLNDNINISNRISIVADPYARENFHSIRYVCFMGSQWKVSSIDVEYPRLIMNLGGLYNGEQA